MIKYSDSSTYYLDELFWDSEFEQLGLFRGSQRRIHDEEVKVLRQVSPVLRHVTVEEGHDGVKEVLGQARRGRHLGLLVVVVELLLKMLNEEIGRGTWAVAWNRSKE